MFPVNHLSPYFGTGESVPGNTGADYQDALLIRKAMAHIINYDKISSDIYRGKGKPLATTM